MHTAKHYFSFVGTSCKRVYVLKAHIKFILEKTNRKALLLPLPDSSQYNICFSMCEESNFFFNRKDETWGTFVFFWTVLHCHLLYMYSITASRVSMSHCFQACFKISVSLYLTVFTNPRKDIIVIKNGFLFIKKETSCFCHAWKLTWKVSLAYLC